MPLYWTSDDLARYVATGRIEGFPESRQKYHAIPTIVDGFRFDSAKEARRYRELRALQRAGAIGDLELQPRFSIDVVSRIGMRTHIGNYTADFRYVDNKTGATVIEDTKSAPTRTTAYRLRKRIVEAIYGITIREV